MTVDNSVVLPGRTDQLSPERGKGVGRRRQSWQRDGHAVLEGIAGLLVRHGVMMAQGILDIEAVHADLRRSMPSPQPDAARPVGAQWKERHTHLVAGEQISVSCAHSDSVATATPEGCSVITRLTRLSTSRSSPPVGVAACSAQASAARATCTAALYTVQPGQFGIGAATHH